MHHTESYSNIAAPEWYACQLPAYLVESIQQSTLWHGHTGIYEAIEKAVIAVDACVKDVIEAAKAQDYEAIIIADHGNADHALNEDGTPNTAHSLNPVPCVYVTENKAAKVENGRLADVAPTILKIMGLAAPAEMDGNVLIK